MDDPLLALLPRARRRLARTDPVMARVLKEHPPEARSLSRKPAFAALVESITNQQVSLAAGRSIYAKLEAACGGEVAPAPLIALGPDGLRAAGLSRPKAAYALDLAQRTASGEVDFERLAAAPDAEVVETLVRVKGIGVWTAQMFLLFHLSRPDVLALGDLGLQIAVADLYGVPREEAVATMKALQPAWSPYCSVVSLALWNWRRVVKERDAAPPAPPAPRAAKRVKARPAKGRAASPARGRRAGS